MFYKQLLLYWIICKLLWSHEKPHVGSHGLGREAEKSCWSRQTSWGAWCLCAALHGAASSPGDR